LASSASREHRKVSIFLNAFYSFYFRRHLLSQEENKANQGVYQDIRAYRAQEQIQIVTAINEALKNDSVN
jgi:23S rRNA maturation mini-RNase III